MKLLVPVDGSRASCSNKKLRIFKNMDFLLVNHCDRCASRRSRSEHCVQFDRSIISGTRSMKNPVIIDEIRRGTSLPLDSHALMQLIWHNNIEKCCW